MLTSRFGEIGLADRVRVGGKGASLGELTRAGIRVPPGFVVTTAAFESAIAALDGDGVIRARIEALQAEDLDSVSRVTAEIRELIKRAALPEALRSTIAAEYAALCGAERDAPVAVRSSATSEDSADASFAGLQDTYLWVRGAENVLQAVRSCWASLYSVESVTYRLRLKLPERAVAMGVVVQRMVNSRSSGVMFTRSPTTGDRSMIAIEGSWGLGSCIVSGEVTPDKFVVSKVTGEISHRTVSQKTLQHVPGDEGVRHVSVEDDRQSVACVSDDEIRELAQVAKTIERHYSVPQDIEWAIEDGTVYLLQSRPETVWASREAKPLAAPKERAFDHVLSLLSGGRR
jgi:pyruvate, water dikinase